MNQSFINGKFPDELELSKVFQLKKTGTSMKLRITDLYMSYNFSIQFLEN